jgi:nicotinamidase-related amidase
VAEALRLDPKQTALALIDLQKSILGRQTAPHSATEVLARSARLAERFRATGGWAGGAGHASYSPDGGDLLRQPIDPPPLASAREAGWDEISPDLGRDGRDIVITKRQWGAFYGTLLGLQLRRRGSRRS